MTVFYTFCNNMTCVVFGMRFGTAIRNILGYKTCIASMSYITRSGKDYAQWLYLC